MSLPTKLQALIEKWQEQAKAEFIKQPMLGGPGDVYQLCARDLAEAAASPAVEGGREDCEHCGGITYKSWHFCGWCGAALHGRSASPASPAPDAPR